jgi:hypothetical protein
MKYLNSFFIALLISLLFVSCGNKKVNSYSDNTDTVAVDSQQIRDKTVYGICGESTAMNTLQLITDNGDTLMLSTIDANDDNMILGGLSCNDKLAVLLNADKTSATQVINLTTLLGYWVEPNPIDGSNVQGVALKEGGIATSINMSTLIYKTWRMFNGKLLLTSTSEGSSNTEEGIDTFKIKSLGADSLTIINSNGETHDFYRQK